MLFSTGWEGESLFLNFFESFVLKLVEEQSMFLVLFSICVAEKQLFQSNAGLCFLSEYDVCITSVLLRVQNQRRFIAQYLNPGIVVEHVWGRARSKS